MYSIVSLKPMFYKSLFINAPRRKYLIELKECSNDFFWVCTFRRIYHFVENQNKAFFTCKANRNNICSPLPINYFCWNGHKKGEIIEVTGIFSSCKIENHIFWQNTLTLCSTMFQKINYIPLFFQNYFYKFIIVIHIFFFNFIVEIW